MCSRNNPRGFTLIEVLVAVAILASGLVLVAQGLARTQQALKISQNLVHVSQLVEQRFAAASLELFEKRKLSTSQESGTERFPGQEVKWTSQTGVYTGAGIEEAGEMNQTEIRAVWKEGASRQNEEVFTRLFLNRAKKTSGAA